MSKGIVFNGKLLRETDPENFGMGKIFQKGNNDPEVIFVKSENGMDVDKWGSSAWPPSCKCNETDKHQVCGFGCYNDQGSHYKACPECLSYSRWDSYCTNCNRRMLYHEDEEPLSSLLKFFNISDTIVLANYGESKSKSFQEKRE